MEKSSDADARSAQTKSLNPAGDEQLQKQSRAVTKQLVELFGDADQTNLKMQGSKFHSDTGRFSGVMDPDVREKLRAAGLLQESSS